MKTRSTSALSPLFPSILLGTLACSLLTGCPWTSDDKTEDKGETTESQSNPTEPIETSQAASSDTFTFAESSNPQGLFPLTTSDNTSSVIQSFFFESLLERDLDTFEWKPSIAKSWSVAEDGKTFTFEIDEKARFWDESPVTPEDVIFSYEAIFLEGADTAPLRPYYQAIESVTAAGPRTVMFKTSSVYFKNFDVAAGLTILNKKFYLKLYQEDKTLSKATTTRQALGTGMWQLESWDENRRLILRRNENYWNKDREVAEGRWNYSRVVIPIIADTSVQLETLKKGDLTIFEPTAKQFAREMEGDPFDKTVLKVKAESKQPQAYRYIGWNQKNELFQDKNVRWALSHLANLKLWNEKFFFGLTEPTVTHFSPKSDQHNDSLKPVPFDPAAARKRLAESGWTQAGDDGFLVKNGKRFSFTIIYASQQKDVYEPFLTEYKNQAAKVGIDVQLRGLEWTSLTKLLDERNYDAVSLRWAGAVEPDLKQIWHSESIADGGSNHISYSNRKLDALIDQHRQTLDYKARAELAKEMGKIIYEDQPYTFLEELKSVIYANQSSVIKPKDTFNYDIGTAYWKLSP